MQFGVAMTIGIAHGMFAALALVKPLLVISEARSLR